jgi:hypothetical protein
MRTPQPTISNLERGTYTLILKVTDQKDQTSEDEVNVYVQETANEAPKADAGKDQGRRRNSPNLKTFKQPS